MLSDNLNPIFVLKMQRVLTFARNHWVTVILCYAFLFFLAFVFRSSGGFGFAWLFLGMTMLDMVAAIAPSIEFVHKRSTGDLTHFTLLTDKQLLDGYVLTGIVYASATTLFLGLPFLDTNHFLRGCMMLCVGTVSAVLFCLYVMSFCTGIKSMPSLIVTGVLVFLFCLFLLHYFLGSVFMSALAILDMDIDTIIPAGICFLLGVASFAGVAYSLALLNTSANSSYILRHFFFFACYCVLFHFLYIFFNAVYFVYGYIFTPIGKLFYDVLSFYF